MVTAYEISRTAGLNRIAGFEVPVLDGSNLWVSAYPIVVFNEADTELGLVENPDELLRLWNDDAVNQAIGRLELSVQSTYFWLIPRAGATPRGFVRGNYQPVGDYNNDFSNDFSN